MELQVYSNAEFGSVRTTIIDGEPFFVGKDIATILRYSNPGDAINKHVDDEDKGVAKCDTPGGIQDLTVINESGLYSLILRSQLPKARQFKRWVTSEILPSIRKNGGYIANQENLTPEQIVANALIVAQNIISQKDKEIQLNDPPKIVHRSTNMFYR